MSYSDSDRAEVRRLVEDWALFRDAGDWESFADVWHDDGWMTATWFQGAAADFIAASRQAFDSGVRILHFLGGHTSRGRGDRAVAQTKMTITQRAEVHGVTVDVTCTGRFYDFLERRDGRWGIVRRQPIYETDRLDPVRPATAPALDVDRLAAYPEGYRHLAYLQSCLGHQVLNGLPGLRGPAVELLYTEGTHWLAGATKPGGTFAGFDGATRGIPQG
ncbi:nuclear transport factor 2 family protein [Allokutzneria sp. A3M-2-11 16]|uniref:nuclear transport factor 2 family protein n=1 Tax=Allokutzneria sp. A3M-2-11 16 TaxID=2962043 RepID=UPI0020B888BA|nr:nuclear transport factor 2 family protein [Allokutzneria sp. A3M-2-11 16]MCP3805086.1 nuclear transport factor 2 family protein [Allokutzneria sp. A3M-2-11 16]